MAFVWIHLSRNCQSNTNSDHFHLKYFDSNQDEGKSFFYVKCEIKMRVISTLFQEILKKRSALRGGINSKVTGNGFESDQNDRSRHVQIELINLVKKSFRNRVFETFSLYFSLRSTCYVGKYILSVPIHKTSQDQQCTLVILL